MLKKQFTLNLTQNEYYTLLDLVRDKIIDNSEMLNDEAYDDDEHKEQLIDDNNGLVSVREQLKNQ